MSGLILSRYRRRRCGGGSLLSNLKGGAEFEDGPTVPRESPVSETARRAGIMLVVAERGVRPLNGAF
jgi:hypothetical protein